MTLSSEESATGAKCKFRSKKKGLWVALLVEHKSREQRCLAQANRMEEAGTSYLSWPDGLMDKSAVTLPTSCPVEIKKQQQTENSLIPFPPSLLFT